MTHGHMARMHMTKPSTQAREAYADAYRWSRQNLYFGLPKLTSESAKLTITLSFRVHFTDSHGTSMKGKSHMVLVKSNKLIFNIELSSPRVVFW